MTGNGAQLPLLAHQEVVHLVSFRFNKIFASLQLYKEWSELVSLRVRLYFGNRFIASINKR